MTPIIDPRDLKTLIKEMERRIPFYTPEWEFSLKEPDSGSALVMIFLNMFQGVIKRFNRVPDKNYIEFLNIMGVRLKPARSVSAPVTFRLSEGALGTVLVKAGTQIGADSEGGAPVVFETEKDIILTAAKIVTAYNVNIDNASISKIPESIILDPKDGSKNEIKMFEQDGLDNLQQHIVYFSQDNLFNIKSKVEIVIDIVNTNKKYEHVHLMELLKNKDYCLWEYWGEEKEKDEEDWQELNISDNSDELKLIKEKFGEIKLKEINGEEHRFIRCKLLDPKQVHLFEGLKVNEANIKIRFIESGAGGNELVPDMMFYNDLPLTIGGFYPFGEKFNLYDSFYIESTEAFTKKGAIITIKLNLHIKEICMIEQQEDASIEQQSDKTKWNLFMKKSQSDEETTKLKTSITKVQWEYWNGTGWFNLILISGADEMFIGEGKKIFTFICPSDMNNTFVNNQSGYWIRAKVISIRNYYSTDFIFLSPWVEEIKIHYEINEYVSMNNFLTYNNLEWRNFKYALSNKPEPIPLFYSFLQSGPAIYLGFDKPLENGPLSMYFSFRQTYKKLRMKPKLKWEYLSTLENGNPFMENAWKEMKIIDNTNGFEKSDIVSFIGGQNFAKAILFDQHLYWIRIVNYSNENKNLDNPILRGIYMNSVWCIQSESIQNGFLNKVTDEENEMFVFDRAPVLNEEIWIKEENILTENEITDLKNKGYFIDVVRDSIGEIDEVWVEWVKVQDFLLSEYFDRHYIIDSVTGNIGFGDGVNGMKPPYLGDSNVKIKYQTGGGAINVKAYGISKLLNTVPYIDEVFNPEAVIGGCNNETVEEAIQRGPKDFIHKGKAITTADFENLAKEAARDVTKAKCFSNMNEIGNKEKGKITLVISTANGGDLKRPSPQILKQVYDYILQRSSDIVASYGRFSVIEPMYLEISVVVTLEVGDMNAAIKVKEDTKLKLNNFLDPYLGNFNGCGWGIGELPHISMFFSIIKTVEDVNHIEQISIQYRVLKDEEYVETDFESLSQKSYLLVTNGTHQVII